MCCGEKYFTTLVMVGEMCFYSLEINSDLVNAVRKFVQTKEESCPEGKCRIYEFGERLEFRAERHRNRCERAKISSLKSSPPRVFVAPCSLH